MVMAWGIRLKKEGVLELDMLMNQPKYKTI